MLNAKMQPPASAIQKYFQASSSAKTALNSKSYLMINKHICKTTFKMFFNLSLILFWENIIQFGHRKAKSNNRSRYKPSYDEDPAPEDENSILLKEKRLNDKKL